MGVSEYGGFSGVVSLYEGDRELETSCAGFAEIPNRRPNDADTVFGMASGCKVLTAVGVLRLVDSGALALDDAAERFLGDCRFGRGVTIRSLLTHTSGIADYFDEEVDGDYEALWRDLPNYRMRSPADFLPLFAGKPRKSPPGERFSYSNAGFVLLARIIEIVSRRSFPAFMRSEVFEGCGMGRTGYYRLDMMPPNAATGYIAEGPALRSNVYSIPVAGGGDGGAFTNGRDMARFWAALADGRLLKPETAELMLGPRVEDTGEGDRYGLGVWIDEDDDALPFAVGADPGVRFLSLHDRRSGRTLTIAANVECPLGPVLGEWKPRLRA